MNKVPTEGTELVDGTVVARVDVLDGKLVHALLDSGTEITIIKKDLVPGISVEGASTIYLSVLVQRLNLPLAYVPIGLLPVRLMWCKRTSKCYVLWQKPLVEDVLLHQMFWICWEEQSEENSLAQTLSRTRGVTQEIGTLGTKDEEVTAEESWWLIVFVPNRSVIAELALVWKYAKEGKGNYEVDGYLFHRIKHFGEYWAAGNSEVQKNWCWLAYFRVPVT
ncbi:CCHC-type domain-containing protein [Trichonephila clavipes]|nr:CCHC-type domain-containing protein [Trichonephila clavipes]